MLKYMHIWYSLFFQLTKQEDDNRAVTNELAKALLPTAGEVNDANTKWERLIADEVRELGPDLARCFRLDVRLMLERYSGMQRGGLLPSTEEIYCRQTRPLNLAPSPAVTITLTPGLAQPIFPGPQSPFFVQPQQLHQQQPWQQHQWQEQQQQLQRPGVIKVAAPRHILLPPPLPHLLARLLLIRPAPDMGNISVSSSFLENLGTPRTPVTACSEVSTVNTPT